MKLPEAYTNRMRQMLGDEYSAFLRSYDEPRVRGLRVNTLKISPEEFERIAPFPVTRIPWISNGYFYSEEVWPARHPYYAAGLYYLQEPSAMTPAEILPVKPGDKVLDLCAAPGGKATELAAKLCGEGLLVANDISNSRAKALLRNLELFGVQNMMVTNEVPARLAEAFPCYFDCILVDAPCSGEGMFRKEPAVAEAWSPERVRFFASQQKEILAQAYQMLRPGGYLLYSTCTFAPEEDEQQIRDFLDSFKDMRTIDTGLLPASGNREVPDTGLSGHPADAGTEGADKAAGFASGQAGWLKIRTDAAAAAEKDPADEPSASLAASLSRCVRIWPHKMRGEGHFLALMQKEPGAGADTAAVSEGNSGIVAAVSEGNSGFAEADRKGDAGFAAAVVKDAREGSTEKSVREKEKKNRKEKKGRGQRRQGNGAEAGKGIGGEKLALLMPLVSGVPGLQHTQKEKPNLPLRMPPAEPDLNGKETALNQMKAGGDSRSAGRTNFRLEERGERAYLVQNLPVSVRGVRFLRNGLFLGEWKKERFEPSQPLAMAQNTMSRNTEGGNAVPSFASAAEDPRIAAYLRGEGIFLTETEMQELPDGWLLVCVDRFPLGWGKKTGHQIKNRLPVSWR